MNEIFDSLEKYNFWGSATPKLGYHREKYTNKIHEYTNNSLIKVLVGQRRAGKSYILRQIAFMLIEGGVDRRNIFIVNRELADFSFLKTYEELNTLLKLYRERVKPKGKIYIFLDEVQIIERWEVLVNSLSQDYIDDYELFISGSNSKLLSSELSTLLSGRYVEFEILPFSYDEYLGITNKERSKQSYVSYMQSGGLPELFQLKSEELKQNYISALKDTVLLRDIIFRKSIKENRVLEDLFIYLVNIASNLVSVRNIANYIKAKGSKVSYDTVAAYIGYIEEAYLIHRVERYNIKGKEVIAGNVKYYANDLAYNNYLYKGFGYGVGYMLENLVYLELRRAGYNVYIGALKDKEIDFVAQKGDRIIYIQSAYILVDKETIEREYSALEKITDNYEKYVVSLDDLVLPSKNGIGHIQAWELAAVL